MRKAIFLFLLSLLVCRTVNIKAQVRIGGDNAPHLSAVLDLNPNDTADAKGGVLLPRVSLTSVEDTVLFGTDISLVRGLMVYNLNDNPPEGIYCYNGEEWVPIGGENAKVPEEPDYAGPRFSISMTPKVLWLGRGGEVGKLRDVTFSADLSGYKVEYVWYLKDTVTQQEVSVITRWPGLQIPVEQQHEIKRGKVYRLYCAVRVDENYETERVDAGKTVYGIGAWIGTEEWLSVANANVGGDQYLTLEQQLSKNHKSAYNTAVMGDRFQWGRLADGHEHVSSENLNEIVPVSMLDPITGQARGKYISKFISTAEDWRSYPDDMPDESRKSWYWRTMEESDKGTDPCGMGDSWFVMTRPQWDSIKENNRLEWLDTEHVRGVAVYPEDVDNLSFYIPMGGYRSPERNNNDSKSAFLWLNSPLTDEADMLNIKSNERESPQPYSRANGAPIRCVSK